MAATLGVGALEFLPYSFFNLLNPLASIAVVLLAAKPSSPSGHLETTETGE